MKIQWVQPSGQAVIETVVILGVLATLMAGLMIIGFVGDAGLSNNQAARVAAFDCDVRPGHCRSGSQAAQSRIRSIVYDRRDAELQSLMSTAGTADTPEFRSLGENRKAIESPDALRLIVDAPRVDGAEQNLLIKLSDAFRRFTLKAGPALFGLPSSDQLTRSTVSLDLWKSHPSDAGLAGQPDRGALQIPALRLQTRIAMISDSWAAADRTQFHRRVKEGESPSQVLDVGVKAMYLPGKDALMPVMDLIGLEVNTRPFRDAFQNVSHDSPYGNSRVTVR